MNQEPERTTVEGLTVSGIATRTTNADETDPGRSKIGPLWGRFGSEHVYETTPHRASDLVYGVYSSYEPDETGQFDRMSFDLTVGVAVSEPMPGVATVRIEPGEYLVFRGKGAPPRSVIDAWRRVWEYFESHTEVARALQSDFEAYTAFDDFAIYVGVTNP